MQPRAVPWGRSGRPRAPRMPPEVPLFSRADRRVRAARGHRPGESACPLPLSVGVPDLKAQLPSSIRSGPPSPDGGSRQTRKRQVVMTESYGLPTGARCSSIEGRNATFVRTKAVFFAPGLFISPSPDATKNFFAPRPFLCFSSVILCARGGWVPGVGCRRRKAVRACSDASPRESGRGWPYRTWYSRCRGEVPTELRQPGRNK